MHTHWGHCPTVDVKGSDLKVGDLLNIGRSRVYRISAFRDGTPGNDFTIDTTIYRGRSLMSIGGFNDRTYSVVATTKCLGTG